MVRYHSVFSVSVLAAGPQKDQWLKWMYDDHTKWIKRLGGRIYEAAHCELRGKDLACWCPLDKPCHADVLLEIANQ